MAERAAIRRVQPIVSQHDILPFAELPFVATSIPNGINILHPSTVDQQHAIDYLDAFPW